MILPGHVINPLAILSQLFLVIIKFNFFLSD